MPYQPDWIPLIEMIAHIQVKDHCDEQQAAIEARKALYDGKVQSRLRGSDELIESNKWASATIFKDGLVSLAIRRSTSARLGAASLFGRSIASGCPPDFA